MNELVLVSGSGRGLGASIAKTFVNNGYMVAINYFWSKEKAEELAKELGDNACAFCADVRDVEQVKAMINEIKTKFNQSPSILVNNAMTEYVFMEMRKFADEISWNEITQHLDVTSKGHLILFKH